MDDHGQFSGAPPGVATFRTKGLVYQGALEFWQKVVPGGVPPVLAAIRDTGQADLAEFLESRIVPGAWYPVMPIVAAGVAAARVRRMAFSAHIRENSAWIARRDLRGVHRILLTLSSVEGVASRLGPLSMRYFDFGAVETRKVRDNFVESERTGIPMPLAQWFVWCAEGFVPVALTMAGAKEVTVRSGPPRPDGERAGVQTARIKFEIAWR